MGDIIQWLSGSISSDSALVSQCTKSLEAEFSRDYTNYVIQLANALAQESNDINIRVAAGIALKNAFSAQESALQSQKGGLWLAQDPALRTNIKNALINALKYGSKLPTSQVISAIAVIELPINAWPDLIEKLLLYISTPNLDQSLVIMALTTIGYVCEAVDEKFLSTHSDKILTAVISGANTVQKMPIRRVALNSFFHCITCSKKNFDRRHECNIIMQVLCDNVNVAFTDTSEDAIAIGVIGLQCINRIVDVYYYHMQPYMAALRYLALGFISHSNAMISMQAIEFWSTIFERETDILSAQSEDTDLNTLPATVCLRFSFGVINDILPLLFKVMCSIEEDVDEDEWCPAMASCLCLQFLCGCVGSAAYQGSLSIIEKNVSSQKWEERNAAILTFGCILEGSDCETLSKPVQTFLPYLIGAMKDASTEVRDSATWTLGRICERIAYLLNTTNQGQIIKALVEGITTQKKRTAIVSCWGLMNFAEQLGSPPPAQSSPTSVFFDYVTKSLLQVGSNQQTDSHIQTSVFETLSAWIASSSIDCLAHGFQVALKVIEMIETRLLLPGPGDLNNDVFSSLFSVLNSIIRRMHREVGVSPGKIPNIILSALLAIDKNGASLITTAAKEDVLLCVGSLALAVGKNFAQYASAMLPFVYNGVLAKDDVSLCNTSIGILVDLSKAMEKDFSQYVTPFLGALITTLGSPQLDISLKPAILSCFGEMAFAVGSECAKGLIKPMMDIFIKAANASNGLTIDSDYAESLREAIIEAISSIINCFATTKEMEPLLPFVTFFLDFIKKTIENILNNTTGMTGTQHMDRLYSDISGILGDLAALMGPQIKDKLSEPWIDSFLNSIIAASSTSQQTRATAEWAQQQIAATRK